MVWTYVVVQEPTSGLDSATAYHLMSSLDTYARVSHKTIIATIHQPSSRIFHMFTNILLINEGQVGSNKVYWVQRLRKIVGAHE